MRLLWSQACRFWHMRWVWKTDFFATESLLPALGLSNGATIRACRRSAPVA